MSFQTRKTFVHLRITNLDMFDEIWELSFFAHKKYSRIFVKLRFNPWCHMDYLTDVLATFLCTDLGSILAVYRGSEISQIS